MKQRNLFDRPSLNPVPRLKAAMREALKGCGLSREQVVDRMNELASLEGLTTGGRNKKVTLPLLDKWVAEGAPEHVIPTKFIPIFCEAVGDFRVLQVLAGCLGLTVIRPEEQKLLEWARAEVEKRRIAKRARKLAEEFGL